MYQDTLNALSMARIKKKKKHRGKHKLKQKRKNTVSNCFCFPYMFLISFSEFFLVTSVCTEKIYETEKE